MRTNDKINRDAITTDSQGIMKTFIESAKAAGLKVLTDEEREVMRKKFFSGLPPQHDCWVFAYGSLIWNPVIEFIEELVGEAVGWHRDFCIHLPIGRGTIEIPGLTMGLDSGGHCKGKMYRIAASQIEHESRILWKREINTDIYIPLWIDVNTQKGMFKALALVVDRNNARYRLISNLDEKAKIIAQATGPLGSNQEYLFHTVDALKKLDVQDNLLEQLAEKVRQLNEIP